MATASALLKHKGRVIYSPLDMTTALLVTNSWGILGYSPSYAQSLVKNVVLREGVLTAPGN